MILSVSRRTDVPAFYSDWFFNRIKDGFVYVRNPFNVHQISKVRITPDIIDCIVFWTKNPYPMFKRLGEIESYPFYFQFTLNPYSADFELNIPNLSDRIDTFRRLSDRIGKKRVIWRYDPIFLTNEIDIEFHCKSFERLAEQLSGYTEVCVISFVDLYKKTVRNLKNTSLRGLNEAEMLDLARRLAIVGRKYDLSLQTCAERVDLASAGVVHGSCIDRGLVESLTGYRISAGKDKNQRLECGCVQSIDIGEYNTCLHDCLYCYATTTRELAVRKKSAHDPLSPLLIGEPKPEDKITERKMFSRGYSDVFITP